MRFPRASGVLLHPTSLPGPGGLGSLGPEAERFLEDLQRAGQRIWQILPLGPTGSGNSPYQSFTAFGGNPLLVSLEWLAEDGILADDVLDGDFPDDRVDFGAVIPFRKERLRWAWDGFQEGRGPADLGDRVREFRERETRWIEDLALFLAIKESQGGSGWMDWPEELARRHEDALGRCREELREAIDRAVFEQFLFFEHWGRVHGKAKELEIEVLGDLPIFVAPDCADVWAHQDLSGCRPTTSARPGSSGETRSTAGTCTGSAASTGGSIACDRHWRCSTAFASITSEPSRTTGRSRPARRPR
jgi:4-alpha-glucanotransferase